MVYYKKKSPREAANGRVSSRFINKRRPDCLEINEEKPKRSEKGKKSALRRRSRE